MKKFFSKKFGNFIIWTDYIKLSTKQGDTQYKQSNTPIAGYHERTIGFLKRDNRFIVSVAVSQGNKDGKEGNRSGRSVVEQRIDRLISQDYDIMPEDKGVTYVLKEWMDLLVKDQHTYANIFGAVDPDYLSMAVNAFK